MLGHFHEYRFRVKFKPGEKAFSLALNDYVTIDKVTVTTDVEGTRLEYIFHEKNGQKFFGEEDTLVHVEDAHYYSRNPLRPFTEF